MIKITKEYILESVSENFTFDIEVGPCVNITRQEIIEQEDTKCLVIDLEFCDYECLANFNELTLNIKDGKDCRTDVFIIKDVCKDYYFTSDILKSEFCQSCQLIYNTNTSQESTYEWIINDYYFTKEENGNEVKLIPLREGTTFIKVKATNNEGCVIEQEIQYDICIPSIPKQFIEQVCEETGFFLPVVNNCDDVTLDWSTFISITPRVRLAYDEEGRINIQVNQDQYNKPLDVRFTVQDCRGTIINGTFCVTKIPCGENTIAIPFNYTFGCEDCEDSRGKRRASSSYQPQCKGPLSIDVTQLVSSEVDWTTFSFVPNTGDTLINNQSLNTPYGVLNLDANNQINYNYESSLTGAQLVNYIVNDLQGNPITGSLFFSSTTCSEAPVANNFDICMLENSTTEYFKVWSNDSEDVIPNTLYILDFPSNVVSTLNSDGEICFNSENFIGTDSLTYIIYNEKGIASNPAVVTINVIPAFIDTQDISICDGFVNLNNQVQGEVVSQWYFDGFTSDFTSIPGDDNGMFANGVIISTGTAVSSLIDFTGAEAGVYTFSFGDNGCNSKGIVNVQLLAAEEYIPVNYEVCIRDNFFNLSDSIDIDLPGGWVDVNSTPVTSFNGNGFNPSYEGEGTYLFNYVQLNTGIYNETICTSGFTLTLEVKPEPTPIILPCIDLCSQEPDYVETGCKIIAPNPNQIPTCEYVIQDLLNLPDDAEVTITNAPYFPIPLYLNGLYTPLNINNNIPINALWGSSLASIGQYQFTIKYGNPCETTQVATINIFKNICKVQDVLINICEGTQSIKMIEQFTYSHNCLKNNTFTVEYINGTSTPTFNSSTFEFFPDKSGQFIFQLNGRLKGSDPTCEECNTKANLIINVTPKPSADTNSFGVCLDNCNTTITTKSLSIF